MEKRPPSHPRVGWEEDDAAPQESSSAAEPPEVPTLQAAQPYVLYGEETMDFIQAFVRSPDQLQDEDLKLKFLDSICTLCRTARDCGIPQDMDFFCQMCELGEKVQVLLKLEPRKEICTEVRQLAMLALAEMSTLGMVLEKNRKVLRACFESVFFLPPSWEMPSLEASLYSQTLHAMDTMLEVMVLSSPASKTGEMLEDILEVLLNYWFSDSVAVQERVMGRVKLLSDLLAEFYTVEAAENEDRGDASTQIQIPVLGKLLGHLFFKLFRAEENSSMTMAVLCSLFTFLSEQKCATLPEVHAQLPAYWEAEITSFLNTPRTAKVQAFGKFLRPAERTGIVLAAIEILGRSSILDKEAPMDFLDVAMKFPEVWLRDVPKVVRHIFAYYDEKTTTHPQSFSTLLVLMANKWPRKVVLTALEVAPIFSDKVYLWKAMFSVRQTLEKVLKELYIQLQDRHKKTFFTQQQKSCLAVLAMLASDDVVEEEMGPWYKDLNYVRHSSMEMVSLLLRALVTLSERAKTAIKMKGLLREFLKIRWEWSWDNAMMIMDIFQNVMGHMEKREASSMAVKAVQRLWHLFDAKEDCVRERSIRLFGDMMGKTVGKDKQAMKRNAWKSLVCLLLHISDQDPSVAQASREAVWAIAELFKWKELKHLVQTKETWRIGECLLARDSRRAEQFVCNSQPYLWSPQAPIREAALRLIGLAARHLTERSEETLAEVLFDLNMLQVKDKDPAMHCLAAQTSLILKCLRRQRRTRFSHRLLCCWWR